MIREFAVDWQSKVSTQKVSFVRLAHEKRFLFNILEDFLSIEMYTNRKKSIHKKVDSLVSPFKKVTRDASLFMAEAPSALGQFLHRTFHQKSFKHVW